MGQMEKAFAEKVRVLLWVVSKPLTATALKWDSHDLPDICHSSDKEQIKKHLKT